MLKTTTIEAQPTFEREKMIYMYIEREKERERCTISWLSMTRIF